MHVTVVGRTVDQIVVATTEVYVGPFAVQRVVTAVGQMVVHHVVHPMEVSVGECVVEEQVQVLDRIPRRHRHRRPRLREVILMHFVQGLTT